MPRARARRQNENSTPPGSAASSKTGPPPEMPAYPSFPESRCRDSQGNSGNDEGELSTSSSCDELNDCRYAVTPSTPLPTSSIARRIGRSLSPSSSAAAFPIGLVNSGNFCYINCTLQCLMSIEVFVQYFLKQHFLAAQKRNLNFRNPRPSMTRAMEITLARIQGAGHTGKSFSPDVLRETLCKIAPYFSNDDQHDAQEFLSTLLDNIHEELNFGAKEKAPTEPDIDATGLDTRGLMQEAAKAWGRYLTKNSSFIVDLFQGQSMSTVCCKMCKYTAAKFEAFMYLSLPLTRTKDEQPVASLSEALEEYAASESLPDAGWKCPGCGKRVGIDVRTFLLTFPPVLIVHLKRFRFSARKGRLEKVKNRLSFESEGFNFYQYSALRKRGGGVAYDLRALIDHSGDPDRGHYVSHVRRGSRLFTCDDESVVETRYRRGDSFRLCSPDNYLLFFVRKDCPIDPQKLLHQDASMPKTWPLAWAIIGGGDRADSVSPVSHPS